MRLVVNGKTKIYNTLLTRSAIEDLWGKDEDTSPLENFEKHSEQLLELIYSDVDSEKITRGLRVLLNKRRSVIQQFTDYVLEGFPE